MSYFVKNVIRFVRELRRESPAAIPAKLSAAAKPKARVCLDHVLQASGAGRLISQRYRGPGIVLMFHEIHDDADGELRTGSTPATLARWIEAVRASGRDIVALDEALVRLGDPRARPFAVLTFDDGYRDNLTRALPVLERLDAPMTLFVPTGMIDGTLYAWWLGLRALMATRETVTVDAMGRTFACADLPAKAAAARHVTAWVMADPSRAPHLQETFDAYGIALEDLVARYGLSAAELERMARHRLVTIGAHTATHPWLALLDEAGALRDMVANKSFLENLLDRPVDHLAYPYGGPSACGLREAGLARAAGFRSAFTTRNGHLFAEHLEQLHMLPREDAGFSVCSHAAIMARLDGTQRAIATRFGDPVAGVV